MRRILCMYLALFCGLLAAWQAVAQGLLTLGAGSAGGVVAVTWGSVASGITLSNGNLTATYSGSNNTNAGIATTSHSSGKWYWEVVWNTVGASNAAVAGFAKPSITLNGYQIGITDSNSYGWAPGSPVYFNGGTVHTIESCGATLVMRFALDIGNSLIWFNCGTVNWNNDPTADPATGVNGFSFSPLGTPLTPAFSTFSNNDQVTAHFASGSFAFSAPSGFSPW